MSFIISIGKCEITFRLRYHLIESLTVVGTYLASHTNWLGRILDYTNVQNTTHNNQNMHRDAQDKVSHY